jgi:cytochrome c oxidase subunit 2
MNLLVYLAIILACAAVWYITRIFELASEMRGDKQYEIKHRDNRLNGRLMLTFMIAFFAFCIWQYIKYEDKLLPVAASIEGKELDWLLNFNFLFVIIPVFFITNFLLFYFAWKYSGSPERKATYYPENHRLELIWTVVPGLVLSVIIFLGLKTWNSITREPAEGENYMLIELYAQQFQWTARYSGDDNMLGDANYKLIGGSNSLGVDSMDEHSWNDFLVSDTLHLMVNKRVKFVMRSQDVIHSAYFPHFRQQMNCVPGMRTQLHFVPSITTDSMRLITHNPDFNYILLCNKICGASHYNMQRPIIVEDSISFMKWYNAKKKSVIFASKAPKEEVKKEEQPMTTPPDTGKTTNKEGMKSDTVKKPQ